MKRVVIPRAIGTLFVILMLFGWWLQRYHPTPPVNALVAQAVQATLTAWPTVQPVVVQVTHLPTATATPVASSPTPTATTTASALSATAELERRVAELINQQRQVYGLHRLTLAAELTAAARRHSQDMSTQAQPKHRGTDGSSAKDRIRTAGYPALRSSEAIRWGDASPAEVVASWLQDDLHRDMLLSEQFSDLGVGYVVDATSPWQYYWTVDLGQRDSVARQPLHDEVLSVDIPIPPTAIPTLDRPEETVLLDPVSDGCPSGSEHEYTTIPMTGVDSSHIDALHGDLNLAQRSFAATTAPAQLIDLVGPTDPDAPQLTNLFADGRTPDLVATYRVNDWNWGCGGDGCRGEPLTDPAVTLLGVATNFGEPIYLPRRNAEIYTSGYIAVVLYADATRLTLAYTRDGTVAQGYAIQMEQLCVDPNLLYTYRQANAAGRQTLPALQRGDMVGMAATTELLVATRDRGRFLDPRSRKEWWR